MSVTSILLKMQDDDISWMQWALEVCLIWFNLEELQWTTHSAEETIVDCIFKIVRVTFFKLQMQLLKTPVTWFLVTV